MPMSAGNSASSPGAPAVGTFPAAKSHLTLKVVSGLSKPCVVQEGLKHEFWPSIWR